MNQGDQGNNPSDLSPRCGSCGVQLEGGEAQCSRCDQPRLREGEFSQLRYGFAEVSTVCQACGTEAPLNGPTRVLHCPSCRRDTQIHPQTWDVLDQVDSEGLKLWSGQSADLQRPDRRERTVYGPGVPLCGHCQTQVPIWELPTGTDGEVPCQGCGQPLDSYPAPAWLREVSPTAAQLFLADREGVASRQGPTRKPRRWYIRFEGKSKAQGDYERAQLERAAEEERRRAEAERQRLEQERLAEQRRQEELRRAEEERLREEKRKRTIRYVLFGVLGFFGFVLLCVLAGFIACMVLPRS